MSRHSERWRRVVIFGLVGVALLAVLVVVVLSPLLFILVADRTTRWQELADVGDAYGGVAAVLSGLALFGIALSLLLQWRQGRSSLTLALRQHHFELIKLGIESPVFNGDARQHEVFLRQRSANLWVAHWAMLWDLGQCDESYLRQVAAELFADEVARAWWQVNGSSWSAKPTRRRRLFFEIFMAECAKAGAGKPSAGVVVSPQPSPGHADQ